MLRARRRSRTCPALGLEPRASRCSQAPGLLLTRSGPTLEQAALEVFARLRRAGLAPSVASACGVMDAWCAPPRRPTRTATLTSTPTLILTRCELNCVAEASAFFDGLLAQGVLRPSEARRRAEVPLHHLGWNTAR